MRDYVFQNKDELKPVYRKSRPVRRLSDRPRPLHELDMSNRTPIR